MDIETDRRSARAPAETDRRSAGAPAEAPAATKPPGASRRRWLMVGLCFFGLTVNYIDRSNLSLALAKMKTDLGLGPGVEGVVLAAFFASYAVCQLPAGHAVDRWGERVIGAFSVAWPLRFQSSPR